MYIRKLPSVELLNELLFIDADSGTLIWKERGLEHFKDGARYTAESNQKKWNTRYANKPAGFFSPAHGVQVRINKKQYLAHRIIWAMTYGSLSESHFIDHMDGDRSNNRISNLRLADHSLNAKNTKKPSDNKSGICGVSRFKSATFDGWQIRWQANKKTVTKYSKDFFDACAIRKSAELENGYYKNHGRSY